MIALILFIGFGLLFGYFATLNTSLVSVHFGTSSLGHVPMYVIILSSFGLGIVFTSLFYFVKSISSMYAIGKKKKELSEKEKEVLELTKRIHELELANTKLRAKNGEEDTDDESL